MASRIHSKKKTKSPIRYTHYEIESDMHTGIEGKVFLHFFTTAAQMNPTGRHIRQGKRGKRSAILHKEVNILLSGSKRK